MTAMSDILRKKNTGEAGNGGEFGTKSHDEAPDGLIRTRRQELDGWPDKLTDPELDFYVKTQGSVIVTASVDGAEMFSVDSFGPWATNATWDLDGDTQTEARDWVLAKSKEVNEHARKEIDAAVARSKAAIIAAATGAPVQQSDADLDELIRLNARAMSAAERDMELASAALMARRILQTHPNAVFARPEAEFDDQVTCSSVIVYDKELSILDTYSGADDGGPDQHGAEIIDLSRNLDARAGSSWWAASFDIDAPGHDCLINLRVAASWSPEKIVV